MKKCTYCGKEYPDETKVCAIDNEPLTGDSPLPPPAHKEEASCRDDPSRKRPKGVWVVTVWMFLFAGLLPITAALFMFFGSPEQERLVSLPNLMFSLSIAVLIIVSAVAAWLGHEWARFALIGLALSHYTLIAFNLFLLGHSGSVPASKMYLVWARIARAIMTMTFIASYLLLSENAKIFFRDYRARKATGGM